MFRSNPFSYSSTERSSAISNYATTCSTISALRLSILATAFILAGAAPVAARTPPAPPPVQTAAPADAASPEAIVAGPLSDPKFPFYRNGHTLCCPVYLPGNGGTLSAVAMMAGGTTTFAPRYFSAMKL
jgi:hypothetical protein